VSKVVTAALALALVSTWTAAPARALDADPWDRVLSAHAHGGGFDYAALKEDEDAMSDLDAFLEGVAAMSEDEPLASWLNAYNAIVVRQVVEHYPIDSVRDVPGFFDRSTHPVAGARRTLDHIENRIIRPRFEDARIHVALNCGAVSCPALYPRAFRQGSLDRVLDRLAQRTVASRRHVRVQDGSVRASQIFDWFSDDFERDAGSVLGWLRRYDGRDRLEDVPDGADVGVIPYDWSLNQRSGGS